MKITVKPKAAPTDVYTIRIPVSLKQQMEATRKLADECDADYNATLIGVLANFNANMQASSASCVAKGLAHPLTDPPHHPVTRVCQKRRSADDLRPQKVVFGSYKSPMGTMDTNPEKPRDLLRKHPFTAVFTATGKSRLSA
jgi:hypothetical protein